MQITVRCAIPGRTRCTIPTLRFNEGLSNAVKQAMEASPDVLWVRVNPVCASIVIRYESARVTHTTLLERLKALLNDRAGVLARREPLPIAKPEPTETTSAFWRFVAMTLLAGIVLVRQAILKIPTAGNLLSPLGLATSLAALPLVKKGLQSIREGRISLESFLGGSILAAVSAGEAMAAMEILWITSAGTLLQAWITERSRRAIRDFLEVTEQETFIQVDGVEVSTPVERVCPGDTVVLHTGEKIAVDGRIVKGEALVDEAPINGRSEPVARRKGHRVYAGTLVREGVLFVKAEKVGDKTYLARILRMVEDSLENRAPIEGVADRLARNLIKAGFAVTLATLVITRSAWRAFSVMLVMACPCATILAASTAVSAALSAAARRHILIKGGRYLEELDRVEVLCFDKTGTLTTNEPEIRGIVNLNGLPENDLLQLAYSAEAHNRHPVALAVHREAKKRNIAPIHHDVCEYILGKGVRCVIHGDEILVGSHKLMAQFHIDPGSVKRHLGKVKDQGLTQIFIARNAEILGVIGFANQERPNLESLIGRLRRRGIQKTAMITGDSKYTATEMARRLAFDECHYSVLPEGKARIIADMKAQGHRVLMVGDGINDALALAEADIGVAMGAGGSELAIEAADIALVRDDLEAVVYLRRLSRKTLRVVHQNFWIATGSNMAGVALGALGALSPVAAGLVHMTHTLGILANSSRLLFFDRTPAGPTRSRPA
jgi:manganese/zinc-transporting P-type ATPase C